MEWQPIETAPRDGRRLLMTDGASVHVCYPKLFPRPIEELSGTNPELWESRKGDSWEYFRDQLNAPGHSWSIKPTHWMPLPAPPK